MMLSALTKGYFIMSSYSRVLSCIVISVWLVAAFTTLAAWIFWPIGIVAQSYFYRVGNTGYLDLAVPLEAARVVEVHFDGKSELATKSELLQLNLEPPIKLDQNGPTEDSSRSDLLVSSGNVMVPANVNLIELASQSPASSQAIGYMENVSTDSTTTVSPMLSIPISPDTASDQASVDSECDLYHGKWFYDSAGPLYTNNSCPVITQMQNCQGNGRPDKEYQNWRWKPTRCELPRFNATKFLELMSGKTLAFVGDSVARNQMESLICLLWQVEVPKNRGNGHMHRLYFRSRSVTIVRIWSSWLVHRTHESFSFAPEGVVKLHLDVPDETFMQFLPTFDVVVISSGHWFVKQSVYVLNNQIVGTQLWSPPKKQQMKMNNIEAFRISVETCLTAMATHPNYTGLTIFRSYSPDHYADGAWNTGGSCTGKLRPALPEQLVENTLTKVMHEKQLNGFQQATKKQTNCSKLRFMDITEAFSYRHDGHPGPYRSPDPNKITTRGPDGRPPPQDCLHWCMPGPVDTWNELMLEIIRREFAGGHKNSKMEHCFLPIYLGHL